MDNSKRKNLNRKNKYKERIQEKTLEKSINATKTIRHVDNFMLIENNKNKMELNFVHAMSNKPISTDQNAKIDADLLVSGNTTINETLHVSHIESVTANISNGMNITGELRATVVIPEMQPSYGLTTDVNITENISDLIPPGGYIIIKDCENATVTLNLPSDPNPVIYKILFGNGLECTSNLVIQTDGSDMIYGSVMYYNPSLNIATIDSNNGTQYLYIDNMKTLRKGDHLEFIYADYHQWHVKGVTHNSITTSLS